VRIPIATYRIQFNLDFPFAAAQEIVPYLDELGISDIYASPILRAQEGSSHGYDMADPTEIDPELGDRAAFEQLVSALHERDMGWLQDVVSNHMAYDSSNPFLMDVLEYGPNSEYYNFFDIQWEHPYEDISGRVLAPMLGDFYGRCLENGELKLRFSETGLTINYYDRSFPLRIGSYSQIVTYQLERLEASLGRDDPDFVKLLGILYLARDMEAAKDAQDHRDRAAFVKGLLWELYQSNSEVREFIDTNIAIFNGEAALEPDGEEADGEPPSAANFDLLESLLADQFFRLAFWKVGAEELNYRRFFTVNELICVSVNEQQVFDIVHSLLGELVEAGLIDGVRIDHIDGLYDPRGYLEQLRERLGDTYIVVEKILESGETLPEDWPVQGTTGYEFLNFANGIFCRQDREVDMTRIYRGFTGITESYEDRKIDCKQLIVDKNLSGDVENLANLLKQIARRYRYASDFTLSGLRRAIVAVLVLFPVYRTYITGDRLNERNRTYVQRVIQAAKRRVPEHENELDFIEQLFLLDYEDMPSDEEKSQRIHFVMRMQQFSGPLMAKGVEDTLLYIYHRLLSLNEVGGSPEHFGIDLQEFHGFNQQQATYWPHSMNASSTHDAKRSEDVRARLNILSEIPKEWEDAVTDWQELNKQHKTTSGDRSIPDANDEYALYQTLVGVFPLGAMDREAFAQRIKDYAIKAVREAKVHTAWLRHDTEYEEGFVQFIDALLLSEPGNPFFERLQTFQKKIAFFGIVNSLAQTTLKLAAPGVPDIYQGTDMWDLSLVDPDNRRPVDYAHRYHELQELKRWAERDRAELLTNLLTYPEDGRIKLYLLAELLAARTANSDVFQSGEYLPVRATGARDTHVVSFVRRAGTRAALVVAPRFPTSLCEVGDFPLGKDVWQDTALELSAVESLTWTDALTGHSFEPAPTLALGQVLSDFPVALLLSA